MKSASGPAIIKPLAILIAEDDPMALDLLHSMISIQYPDAIIHCADNGLSALQQVVEYSPDIVITDVNMPEMDGIRMAGEISHIKTDIRIIAITACDEMTTKQDFIKAGAIVDHCLVKPISSGLLFQAIDRCCSLL